MKFLTTLLLFVAISATSILNAQNLIQIKNSTVEFDDKQRPCIQVNVDPEPDLLKEKWRDYLKDNYDFKLSGIGFLSNKELLSAEEVQVKGLSSKQVDFYTRVVEDKNGSEMKIFVRFGYDIYLSKAENPSEYNTLRSMVEGFLNEYLPAHYAEQIDETEDRIEELNDESEDLEKEIKDDTAEIADLKEKIQELEKNLDANAKKLSETKSKLSTRQAKLKRIKAQSKRL